QHWPHAFHAATAGFMLIAELLLCWLVFFPKWSRRIAFIITTPLQIGIILTANYAFLNYLVLFLGFLLLDDDAFRVSRPAPRASRPSWAAVVVIPLIFVTTVAAFFMPNFPTVQLLEPFRVANTYGLFAVMTRARYEIEFQGTSDGKTWIAYPFRYKPQDVRKAPGIYAPYQPRFEWNLWFASLGDWHHYSWVARAELTLLEGSPEVLQLFAADPFAGRPPEYMRAVRWQYWFTTPEEKRRTGAWWKRQEMGLYAPVLQRTPGGPRVVQVP
ncbi:MAG TPA: lipase maturation factor family protein, partial [Myxococcales bacterium]